RISRRPDPRNRHRPARGPGDPNRDSGGGMTKSDKTRTSEAALEDVVVETLFASPLYRYRTHNAFDAATALDAEELAAFVQETQPKEWARLTRQFPGTEQTALAAQVTALAQKRGTLDVLRNGVSFNGINLQLAYFRPSAPGNPEHQANYQCNRFGVMRQVRFSTRDPAQSIDVLILLNGLPIASLELK